MEEQPFILQDWPWWGPGVHMTEAEQVCSNQKTQDSAEGVSMGKKIHNTHTHNKADS